MKRLLSISAALLFCCAPFASAGDKGSDFIWRCYTPGRSGPNLEYFAAQTEGHGMDNSTWIAILGDAGPRFVESIDDGRKAPKETDHYDKNGKVVKIEKEEKSETD